MILYTGSTASLTGVTISGNMATDGSGGIHGQSASGSLNLTNVTITGNTGYYVGGLDNENNATVHVVNSTIAGNHYTADVSLLPVGGIFNDATITFLNTIIAGNDGNNCHNDIHGTWTSLGHNLDGGNPCLFTQPGALYNTDPLLGALADNGGPTQTMALLVGSPAIDAGMDIGCPATDQRGIPRPFGPHCDIGAYEFNFLRLVFLPLVLR